VSGAAAKINRPRRNRGTPELVARARKRNCGIVWLQILHFSSV
jgi:hypothetical protein